MIRSLKIENFKSVRYIDLPSKKINIFIGEPNSGKSNIIEALTLFSPSRSSLKEAVRLQNLTDLFYDNLTDKKVTISINDAKLSITLDKDNLFSFALSTGELGLGGPIFRTDVTGNQPLNIQLPNTLIKFYVYRSEVRQSNIPGSLVPPYGENLVSVIISNGSFKSLVQEIFRSKGFRLKTKPVEFQIEISKEKDDEIYSYAYSNVSETLKRIIFFMACLETNSNSTLLFDEPEANTFPFYTKYFAERISSDLTNQFFFTTHNRYLLESIVAKTPFEDLNVVIAYMKDYETKLRVLSKDEVSELMGLDIFFNLKRYTEEA